MKRFFLRTAFLGIILFIALFFGVSFAGVGAQSSTELYIDPSKVEYWTPATNETFTANVTIANVFDLTGFDFTIYWNYILLDVVYIQIQPFLNPPYQIDEQDCGAGWYRLKFTSTGEPKTGNGPLVSLSFKVTYDPTWPENVTSALDLADTYLYSDTGSIDHDVYDGEYSCYSTPPLSLTTMTDKTSYTISDTISIYGDLTLGLSPVQDGLVALEVDNSKNKIVVIRTALTGVPPANQIVEIIDVSTCGDMWGTPKNSFNKGSTAFFNVTVKNNGNETKTVWNTVNIYDSNLTTLGTDRSMGSVIAGATVWSMLSIQIPETASVGEAIVYASALTGQPRDGGTAYCPEKSATFNILGDGSPGPGPPGPNGSPVGSYNLTFKLLSEEERGEYTIYANSEYTIHEKTQKVTNEVTITRGGGPEAIFEWMPPNPSVNETVTFDATNSKLGWNGTHWTPIVSYTWDFGDDNITTVSTPTIIHTYKINQTYTVSLNVTDTQGLSDLTWKTINVTIGLEYDFNGNGEVDIFDVRRVAKAYGSAAVDDPETPWDETEYWDPVVDVAPEGGDDKIDIFDVRKVAKHYGETI